ncbi:MAG: hypothetical protein ACOY5H_04475 [Pseudomonadota bacterium]
MLQMERHARPRWPRVLAPWIAGLWLCAWILAAWQVCCQPVAAAPSCHVGAPQPAGWFPAGSMERMHADAALPGPAGGCALSVHAAFEPQVSQPSLQPADVPVLPAVQPARVPALTRPRTRGGFASRDPPPSSLSHPLYLLTARLRL